MPLILLVLARFVFLRLFLYFFYFFQSKGVRLIAVAIGPDSKSEQSQKVLNETGGENVFYVSDYSSLEDAVNDIVNLICRMYLTTICRYSISALKVPVVCL